MKGTFLRTVAGALLGALLASCSGGDKPAGGALAQQPAPGSLPPPSLAKPPAPKAPGQSQADHGKGSRSGAGVRLRHLFRAGGKHVCSVSFAPDGRRIAVGSFSALVEIWEIDKPQRTMTIDVPGPARVVEPRVAWSPDGNTLAIGAGQRVKLYSLSERRWLKDLPEGDGPLWFLRWIGPYRLLQAYFDLDNHTRTIYIHELPGAKEVLRASIKEPISRWVDAAPDGKMVAVPLQARILLYGASGQSEGELISHTGYVDSLAFSLDGKWLAAGGIGGLGVWDVATRRPIQTVAQQAVAQVHSINFVAFTPDDSKLVLTTDPADRDEAHDILVVDIATGTIVAQRQLEQRRGEQLSRAAVALSPDGKILATVAGDPEGGVRIWDLDIEVGPPVAPPTAASAPLQAKPSEKAAENLALKPSAESVFAPDLRTWTSADGKFHVQAVLVKMVAGIVHLKRTDGQVIQVPIDKLSVGDQEFLRER